MSVKKKKGSAVRSARSNAARDGKDVGRTVPLATKSKSVSKEPRRARVKLSLKHMHQLTRAEAVLVRLRLRNGEEQIIEIIFNP